MENMFFTSLYGANYTLSTIKTTNEVIFVYADHATYISSSLFDFFFLISLGHLPATYTSKLFRTLLNKKNNWFIY